MAGVPALQAYIEKLVGGRFEVRDSAVIVNTTTKKVVDHNYERLALTIVNVSGATVYLAPTTTVTGSAGIALLGSGASLTLTARDDLVLVGREWYALASTLGGIYILEVFRYGESTG